jgi:hypothetical protein
MASNEVLNRKAEGATQVARVLAELTDQTKHVYSQWHLGAILSQKRELPSLSMGCQGIGYHAMGKSN